MNRRRYAHQRVAQKITETLRRLRLDLRGLRVLTEAATGPYVVTPVIAACAGAHVIALTKDSRYGTVDAVRCETIGLAEQMGVASRIEIVESVAEDAVAGADIVTNSGHLRPIDAKCVRTMTADTVVPLMYESWEFRQGDIDLEECRRRGVVVAGTNERHPDLRVFDYLGLLALAGLSRCGVPVTFSRLLLVCDNPFCSYIQNTLVNCGGVVEVLAPESTREMLRRQERRPGSYDAVIVAETPTQRPIIGRAGKSKYSLEQIGEFDALVQIWGDVERTSLDGVVCHPAAEPEKGHMGMLLSELGPDPIVRLQAGGLKVGQQLASEDRETIGADSEPSYLDTMLVPPEGCRV